MGKEKIADEFGKKIGGSKRDQWKARGLMIDDLIEMNEAEVDKYVVKNNVWPKPDYEALKAEGVAPEALYLRKCIRDKVATKPAGNAENYIKYVGELKNYLETLTSPFVRGTDVVTWLGNNGFAEPLYGLHYHSTAKLAEIGGAKLFNSIGRLTPNRISSEIKKKRFLYSDEEKILAEFEIIPKAAYKAEKFSDWEGGADRDIKLCFSAGWMRLYDCTITTWDSIPSDGWLVVRNNRFLFSTTSYDEAKSRILRENKPSEESPKPKKARKKKFVPKQLEWCKRTPEPKYRKPYKLIAARNVTGDDYLEDFGFYGGEFGTWMSEKDRQESLNLGYDALRDLAIALDIDPCDIALKGQLAIAFGARGHGNAMAHYEPLRKVINLTKMRGAGSLAHEYGHALDFIVGEEMFGRSLSETAKSSKAVEGSDVLSAMVNVRKAMKWSNGLPSEYYINSQKFDKLHSKDSQGYWASDVELFARAFTCYIKDRIEENGITNDYLCGHADACVTLDENLNVVKAYPEGNERMAINAAIDELIEQIKKAFFESKDEGVSEIINISKKSSDSHLTTS